MSFEPLIRVLMFFTTLGVMSLWERAAPCRRWVAASSARRWHNLGLAILNTLLVRLFFPLAAVGLAVVAEERGWGLWQAVSLPYAWAVVLSVVILDGIVYLHHVLFHALPTLWRIHRVHHADQDFDVTTGLRFHPLEALMSMAVKSAVVVALGAPPLGVLLFELILSTTAMFNHSNVSLPPAWERVLRWFVVTPDMHRVHHSVVVAETNSNYGFSLPWWDYLLGTYRPHAALSQTEMTIGLKEYQQDESVERIPGMLWLPFRQERLNPGIVEE
ncbi:MAG: sterol desaturase family protein [Synechococcales cyanobacterium]